MTDYFAMLDEPRRPWLDPEVLKTRFLKLAAQFHPDRVHTATESDQGTAHRRFAELNAAYNCLRQPRERLLHLLELERGVRPDGVQKISSPTMDLFTEVSRHCREADVLLAARANVTSPLLNVQLFERGMALTEKLNSLLPPLNVRREALIEQMKNLNMAWESAPPVGTPTRVEALPCNRLERIYRELSFLTRWSEQIQERVVQLSF